MLTIVVEDVTLGVYTQGQQRAYSEDMHPSETIDWNAALVQISASAYQGPKPETPFWFGDSLGLCNELTALVVSRHKTATASLLWEWQFDGDALPNIGQCDALLDWANNFVGIIQTTAINVVPFQQVSAEFAALEGEGDLSLDFWTQAHWSCFNRACARIGKEASLEMPVVCQEFTLNYLNNP